MKKTMVLGASLSAALLVPSTAAAAPLPKLFGEVGPGFTITLKNAKGKKVTSVKAGRYQIVIRDRSDEHNFNLRGTAARSSVDFVGTKKAVVVTLRKGRTYTYVCDPHSGGMRGTVRAV